MTAGRTHPWYGISASLLLLLWASNAQADCITAKWKWLDYGDYFYSWPSGWVATGGWDPTKDLAPSNTSERCFAVEVTTTGGTLMVDKSNEGKTQYQVTSLVLGSSWTFKVLEGSSYTVETTAQIDGFVYGRGGTFVAGKGSSLGKKARLKADGKALVTVPAEAYSPVDLTDHAILLSSGSETPDGTSSLLNLSALTRIDDGFSRAGGQYVHTIAAQNGGVIDLSSLGTLVGPGDDEYLKIAVSTGGNIRLGKLATILHKDKLGSVRFVLEGAGVRLDLPALASAQFTTFELKSGAQLNAEKTPCDYSAAGLSGDYALMLSEGKGSALNVSRIGKIDDSFFVKDSESVHTITARNHGTIDLSGVKEIIGPSDNEHLDIVVNSGGSVLFRNLKSIAPAIANEPGYVWFKVDGPDVADGNGVELPSLSSVNSTLFHVTNGARLSAAGSRFTYRATGLAGNVSSYLLLSSNGSDPQDSNKPSILNLSGMTELNDGFSDGYPLRQSKHEIVAEKGGVIDLSGLQKIIGPQGNDLLNVKIDHGGIDLSSLRTVEGTTGSVSFSTDHGGTLLLGPVEAKIPVTITLNHANDLLVGSGDWNLGPNMMIRNDRNAALELQGDLAYTYTDATRLSCGASCVSLDGAGPQELEVGGWDVGTTTEFSVGGKVIPVLLNKNFGFGRLVVGKPGRPTAALLVDYLNNGNRYPYAGHDYAEALYLFGHADPDDPNGLRIERGSTLYMGGLKVYALYQGRLTDLSTLFGPNQMVIRFPNGGGDLALGRPDVNDCRNLAARATINQKTFQVYTEPNTLYHVWFDFSALPNANAAGRGLRVSAAGSFEDFVALPAGWQTRTWRFVAKEAMTIVTFAAPDHPDLPFSGALANVVVWDPNSPYPPECFRLMKWSIADDTGIDPDDKLTKDSTPVLTLAFSKPIGAVGDNLVVRRESDGADVPKQIAVGKNNSLVVTFDAPLTDGRYTAILKSALRAASGEPFNGGRNDTVLSFTIDTKAPTVAADRLVTSDPSPALTGTVDDPRAEVKVKVGGKTYTAVNNGNGTWTLPDNTITPPLSDGYYNVEPMATDPAGNVGKEKNVVPGELTNELTIRGS